MVKCIVFRIGHMRKAPLPRSVAKCEDVCVCGVRVVCRRDSSNCCCCVVEGNVKQCTIESTYQWHRFAFSFFVHNVSSSLCHPDPGWGDGVLDREPGGFVETRYWICMFCVVV